MSSFYKKAAAYASAAGEKTQFAPLGKIDLTDTVNASASNIIVYGRSVVINQLIDFSLVRDYVNQTYPAHIVSGINIMAYDIDPVSQLSNCVVLNGTASADVEILLLSSEMQFNRIPGHYYFLTGNNNSEASDSCYMVLGNEGDSDVLIDKGNPGNPGIHDGQIKAYEESGNVQSLYIKVLSGTTLNEVIFRPQLIDLTQLFGYDQSGSPYGALSYGEIRSLISSDYYSYNPGKIVGVGSITIKSTADVGGETSSVQATISTTNGIGLYPISNISDVNNGLFDVLDFKNKQHTKAVDSVNVGGDSFSEITIDIDTYFQSSSSAEDAEDGFYCLSSDGTECIVQGGKFCFKASSNIYPSLSQWNEHVTRLSQAGCPLTVVYKKATPETVSVQNGLPTIKTYRGGTTVSIYTNDFSNPDVGYLYAGQDGGIAFNITYPLQESGSANVSYKHKIYTTLGTPTVLSGDVVSATDSAGVPAKDYTVKGKSIVWNQMVENPDFSNTTVDTRAYVFFRVQQLASPYEVSLAENLQEPGLVDAVFTIPVSGECRIKHNGSQYDIDFYLFDSVKDHKYYICFNFTSTNPTVTGGIAYDKAQLFDLTQMFGAGNEPATVAQFRAMFPDDYYPYNAGELKSIMPTSVEASGVERFQMLDKSKYPATTTIDGVTFTNNGDGTITYNGTTSTWANYTLQSGLKVVAGHKYFSYVGENTNDKISVLLYADSDPYNTFDNRFPDAAGGISIALKNSNMLYYQPKPLQNISYSNFILKPQFFDLTEMFGAGNEPTTPAEFWQRVPEKLYGYNPSAYKSVNIPSSKYFPDGMRSAGSAYDEINLLSQKVIKRIGIRAYQTGDENDVNVMTDKTNTVYELATPVETTITPPLQALSTFKGFASFSAPNSLTQNGPLSVTYYAEGGANPEKGWLTSYKRKLYMGRSIEWNQLLQNPNFSNTVVDTKDRVDFRIRQNISPYTDWVSLNVSSPTIVNAFFVATATGYGEMIHNGATKNIWFNEFAVVKNHKYYATLNFTSANPLIIGGVVYDKAQLFDLTKMFGAGNEPATPAEFWSYFDHKVYPYNTGETQPLFKISRKSITGRGV